MQKIFAALRAELTSRFPERANVVDGSLAAVLSSESVLLIGPPGTAKSMFTRAIAQAFGGSYFERLLTKFSTPEELYGPVSLSGLEHDRFERVTTGMLPTAEFAFVDEVFKANSAILNSMLTLINERTYSNGGAPLPVPLVSLFGSSNELPEGKELEALFDRFVLRFQVDYLLRPQNLRGVLTAPEPKLSTVLDMKTLRAAQAEVLKVKVTDATVDALITIRDALKAEGIVASDRRWKKTLRLVQATAWLAGEKQTSPEDLTILVDALWREPKERAKVAKLVGRLADPVSMQATEILDAAREAAENVARIKTGDRKIYIASAAQTLEAFTQQQEKLVKLGRSAGRRAQDAIDVATADITLMHEDLARAVSSGLGLRRTEK